MPFQDLRDCAAGKLMSQVGQCTLNPPIAPPPILLRQAHDQILDLAGGARSPR
jgi:hypothetical protein